MEFSKKETTSLLEICYKAVRCKEKTAFRDIFFNLQELFDFNIAFCGYGNPIEGPQIGINVFNADEFLKMILSGDNLAMDPVLIELMKSHKVQSWIDVHRRYEVKKISEMELDTLGTNKGLTHGIGYNNNKNIALFSFADEKIKNDERTRAILEHTVPHLSEALIRIIRPENKKPATNYSLTKREIEVLKWTKEGKTAYETSVILGIRERTVNFHISNIKQKLDVSNKVQAVAAALHAEIISF